MRRWSASLAILVLCLLAAAARTVSDSPPAVSPSDPPPDPPSFKAALNAATLTVKADVSSETHADALEQALDRHFPGHDTTLYWRIGNGDADWQLLTLAALDALAETTVSRMRLDPRALELEGLRPEGRLFDVRLARIESIGGDEFASTTAVYEADSALGENDSDACATMFRSIRGEPVRFFSGTADLRPSSFALLDRYSEFAGDCPSTRLAVFGHTDAAGDDAYNQYLSEERAGRVKDYLVAAGLSPDRVVRSGKGSSEPVADNGTAWGRSQNRRIEIRMLPD